MNLGIGFPQLTEKTVDPKGPAFRSRESQFIWRRERIGYFILCAAFLLLLLQVIRLQLLQGPYYRVLAEQNRIKTKIIHAARGTIYDREGNALVHNIPGFREKIADCREENPSAHSINSGQVISAQVFCYRVVTREEVLSREAKNRDMSNLETDNLRQYTKPEVIAHMLGFVSQVSREELNTSQMQNLGYKGGDVLGRGGIEEQYEEILKGVPGKELIETDAQGREIRVLGKVEPRAGGDITLTIDSRLQEVAFDAMRGKTGAVLVSDPNSGEILSLLSTPSFDANLFTLGPAYKSQNQGNEEGAWLKYKTVEEILNDEKNRPLFNRAVSGLFPPGSTFKIVTAAAALEKGVIDEYTEIEDTGILRVGEFSFANWYFTLYGGKEGMVDVIKAIKRSNDIFFYKAAEMTGLEDLRSMAIKFGLANKLGIDLPHEDFGLVPSEAWKKETFGEGWYLGDMYHLGIGQGYLLVTPLQVNMWTSVIANGGTLYKPHILKNMKNEIRNTNFLSDKTISLIREGMRQSCDFGGAAFPLFGFKVKNANLTIDERNFFQPNVGTESSTVHVPIACKTGTAEFGDANKTHAWITAYAPLADPQIVVTVLVEGGGQGSEVAAPVAKKIFEEWFGR